MIEVKEFQSHLIFKDRPLLYSYKQTLIYQQQCYSAFVKVFLIIDQEVLKY